MSITALPTPAPSRTQSQTVFDSSVEALVGALPTMVSEMNTDIATTNGNVATVAANMATTTASAAAAASSAVQAASSAAAANSLVTASDWVSGGTYAVGAIRVSPVNRRLYKCILAAGAGQTTDPSLDTTYWKPALFDSLLGDARFAAVSATLPALSYVAACFHLAKDDTDKGAWRKRKGQSWRSEARSAGKYLGSYANATAAVAAGGATGDVFYNTTAALFHEITGATTSTATYRAGREDYPANALITAEAGRIIIWDLDSPSPSMWRVFITGTSFWLGTTSSIGSVIAKNNYFVVGYTSTTGAAAIDMIADSCVRKTAANTLYFNGKVSDSNSVNASISIASNPLVSASVNHVAILVTNDSPYDERGMPIPTILAATASGLSVWLPSGSVFDITYGGASHSRCAFDANGRIVASLTATSPAYTIAIPTADNTANPPTGANVFDQTAAPACFNVAAKQVATGGGMIALGSSSGLELLVDNVAAKTSGIRAVISSVYNTGWMPGDIRRCFLANSTTLDRSVKAGTLTVVGAPTETVVAGGRNTYSGFSAANYFQEASHADWNALGTGDFYFAMSGVKWGTSGVGRVFFSIGDGVSAGSCRGFINSPNTLVFGIHNGATFTNVVTSTATFTDTGEHFVEFLRTTVSGVASTIQIRVDGVVVASAVSALTISNAGNLRIGENNSGVASLPLVGGQISCFRISATVPSIEASRAIAAMENALNGGNACLLSNSDTVSRIAYDNETGSMMVGNGTNIDTFAGLKRIASAAHGVTTLTAPAAANGRTLIAGTGAIYAAPERNISAELNEAMHKEPRTQQYSFTTPAATTTQALPLGWKAQGIAFNTTDGTFLGTYTQTFDGFVWTLGSLTASKAYQINLVETL